MAGHAFEAPGDAEQLPHLGVGLLHLLQRRIFLERLVEGHVERGRNLFRDLVDVAERHLQHASDVADHRLRLHRAERDDLRHVLAAVLAGDVVDHLTAPPLAEVDVDVGHRHALRVQEPFENQVEVERVDVGDAQRVGDEAPGRRSAAGPHRNPLFARVADEIPDDHEVPGVLHLLDHLDLVREAALVLVDRVRERAGQRQLLQPRQTLLEPFPRHVLEVVVQREAGRHVEVRQMVLALGQHDVAAFGDPDRVQQRLGIIPERGRHLGRRLQEELLRLVPQPLLIAERLARADAQQHVVRVGVRLPQVVHVVRADERQAEIARQRGQRAVHGPLLVDAVPLHFEEEVAGAQDVAVRGGRVVRFPVLAVGQPLRDLAFQAGAQSDQPLAVLRQQVLVNPRLVVEAFGIAGRDQLDEVVVALERLRQEHQVILRLPGIAALGPPVARRDVDFAPQNRLHAARPRVVVEDHGREQIAVLGHREAGIFNFIA